MHTATALLSVFAASALSKPLALPQQGKWGQVDDRYRLQANYCNYGTAGDGTCEKNGLQTYCCIYAGIAIGDAFPMWRNTTELHPEIISKSADGQLTCNHDKIEPGYVICGLPP